MDAVAITEAGLESLDDLGLDRLTMRAVADRLGVQVGGLYYHVPDKSGLLRLMADRLCAEIAADIQPDGESWRDEVLAICMAVRRRLLAHRDGARIFAGSPLVASMNALGLMDRLIAALAQGVRTDLVGIAGDALFSYATGYVLQEQHDGPIENRAAPLDELQRRFPHLLAAIAHPPSHEDTYSTAIDAIVAGFEARGA